MYDSFKELQIAVVAQRAHAGDPRVMGGDASERLLYKNNFKVASTFFDNVGALKAGNAADFIAVNYSAPTPLDEHNLFSHLTSNFSGNVDTVVVNGKVLKKNGELTTVDKEAVFAKCREHAERLWKMI